MDTFELLELSPEIRQRGAGRTSQPGPGERQQEPSVGRSSMHALTVDVEDWPQSTLDLSLPVTARAVRNTRLLLKILRTHRVHATFFVLRLLAERFPTLVTEIAADGHEIGSHGYSHKPIYGIGPHAFAEELANSVRLLEAISGQRVVGFRAPDFSITNDSLWALDILADQGLSYDSSIFPAWTPRYGIPGAPRHPYYHPNGLMEVPLSTVQWAGRTWPVAGGGYLRLYPYLVTQWAIRRTQAEGAPAVVYLHPYELDPAELDDIPWRVPPRLRLSQGLGRRRTRAKLEKLLTDFRFGSVAEVLQHQPSERPAR